MTFRPGVPGNPHGNRHHSRHLLNQRFLQALLLDFEAHGRKAIEECRKQSPLGYVKVLGHLVPREHKFEYNNTLKNMSDEELEATLEYLRSMLAAQAVEGAKVIEASAETAALAPPIELDQPKHKNPNPLLDHADTALGARERPRKRKLPSP